VFVFVMADPLAGLSSAQRAQLRLLCWVACVDGVFADEERELLSRLASRLLPGVDPADAVAALLAQNTADLEQLVAQLGTHDQRLQLVKLAFEMAHSSRNPDDDSPINPAERGAYRQLLDRLGLPETEVNQAEWAAKQALQDSAPLLDRLNRILFGWGAWPTADALEFSGTHWL
jgi:uncharacterized tellurite resistance protein B-like protein